MGSYKVLIAEDEGLIAHDIASRLEALGHIVVGTAATAEEALQLAPEAEVVLMDIRLDGPKDGIDAAREIRARYHLPVIFLTAHADRRTVERAKLTEPFGYIVKPLAPAALQTTLEIAMHKHAMDRQLEEREARLRTTLSSVADAVVVTDAAGRAILANPAAEALFACPTGQLAKMDLAKLLPGDPVALAIVRDAPVPIDAAVFEQAIEGSAAPIKATGSTIGCVVTLRNVTVQRWQEQQLRQSQKMEAAANLAGSVATQYASLLGIIRQETQRLLTRFALPPSGPSSVRQSLEAIQQAALEAQEINGKLAGLGARPGSRPQALSLNGMLRRMRKTLDSVAGLARLTLQADAAAPKVYADADQMEQMILSIVGVAAGGASEGSEITIQTGSETKLEAGNESTGSYFHLSVSVPGAVVNMEDASTNLELDLADRIATEFGGMIKVDAENGRTRFNVLLPAWADPVPVPAHVTKPRTLLLIEPRESVRTQLHNFFEAAGYNMLEASNRDEALALLELHAFAGEEGVAEDQGADKNLDRIDLLIGDRQATAGLDHVPVLVTDDPPGRVISQSELLERVRARLPDFTFSASA